MFVRNRDLHTIRERFSFLGRMMDSQMQAQLNRAALKAETAQLQAEAAARERAEQALGHANAQVRGLEALLADARRELAENSARLVVANTMLTAIQASTAWKITWPARQIGARMPRSVRRAVRGLVDITFQLLRKPGQLRAIQVAARVPTLAGQLSPAASMVIPTPSPTRTGRARPLLDRGSWRLDEAPAASITRNEKILASISRSMKILEVGPGYSPVLARADGWNVYSLDHCAADELRRKYSAANVDISGIQDVDFVWQDGPLDTAIPVDQLGTFDACIGSHIIEHIPDLVGFFHSMERILSPTGIVSLVVPDKQFCFDFFQPLTMTGEVLAAHRERRTRHTRTAEFNAGAYMVRAGGQIAWGQRPTELLEFCNGDLKAANRLFFRTEDDHSYHDVHAWYFTVSSFRLIMLELAWMGHLDFKEINVSPTQHCEFFITLGRGRPPLTDDQYRAARIELLTNVLLDFRQQTDFLIDGPNYVDRSTELYIDRGHKLPSEIARRRFQQYVDTLRRRVAMSIRK